MRRTQGTPFNESREHVATSASPDRRAAAVVPEATATDTTLSRIEKVMNLLLSARFSATSVGAHANSEHDRLQAELLGTTLDEALAEQRILWLELAPTMSMDPDGQLGSDDATPPTTGSAESAGPMHGTP